MRCGSHGRAGREHCPYFLAGTPLLFGEPVPSVVLLVRYRAIYPCFAARNQDGAFPHSHGAFCWVDTGIGERDRCLAAICNDNVPALELGLRKDVKTVQSWMRHANSTITMDIYTHAVDSKKRSAQSKVVGMVLPNQQAEVREVTA